MGRDLRPHGAGAQYRCDELVWRFLQGHRGKLTRPLARRIPEKSLCAEMATRVCDGKGMAKMPVPLSVKGGGRPRDAASPAMKRGLARVSPGDTADSCYP